MSKGFLILVVLLEMLETPRLRDEGSLVETAYLGELIQHPVREYATQI